MTEHVRYPDLVRVREQNEARWCYELRMQHVGPRAIAERSPLPASMGGLGYAISAAQVRKRLDSYVAEHNAEHVEQREFYITQELDDLDAQYRAAQREAEPVDLVATIVATLKATGVVVHSAEEAMTTAPECIVLTDGRTRLAALTALRQINERRAKLMGLDAPTRAAVDVTVKDAASAELEAMLAEAGIGVES